MMQPGPGVTPQGAIGEGRSAALRPDAALTALRHVVHELRTPMTVIQGNLATLASDPDRELGAEVHREFLGAALDECARLQHLVDRLLALDPSAPVDLSPAPGDLAALVRRHVAAGSARWRLHRIHAHTPASVPIELDAAQIGDVLDSLLSNAVKFSPEGSDVRVTVTVHDGSARVSVADQGIGIARGCLPRLFQPFERVMDEPQRYPGAGLGLAAARRRVEAHGGRIGVDSTVGRGSNFWFELPAGR